MYEKECGSNKFVCDWRMKKSQFSSTWDLFKKAVAFSIAGTIFLSSYLSPITAQEERGEAVHANGVMRKKNFQIDCQTYFKNHFNNIIKGLEELLSV